MSTTHIAIIGAGISGLSCANALQKTGLNVTVFDKSRGAGGRMSTRRGDDWQCDHGAQYFTATHPDFRAEVLRWQQAGVAALWQPRLTVIGDHSAHSLNANVQRFVGTPRMTSPCHLLASTLSLSAQHTIQQLQQQADGWHLYSAEQGELNQAFSHVVLAVPATQAQALLKTCESPLLDLASNVHMRPSWALMLRFNTPVTLDFDAAFVNQGPLRWLARNNSKPARSGQETWLLHASAEWSEAHLELSSDTAASLLMEAFRALGGPKAEAWSIHRWRYADTLPALTQGHAWQAEHGLGLCGDWLNGGKVEGAWRSGQALAREIIAVS